MSYCISKIKCVKTSWTYSMSYEDDLKLNLRITGESNFRNMQIILVDCDTINHPSQLGTIVYMYCLSKKSCPNLYSKLLYKLGQYLLDIQ